MFRAQRGAHVWSLLARWPNAFQNGVSAPVFLDRITGEEQYIRGLRKGPGFHRMLYEKIIQGLCLLWPQESQGSGNDGVFVCHCFRGALYERPSLRLDWFLCPRLVSAFGAGSHEGGGVPCARGLVPTSQALLQLIFAMDLH